MRRLTPRVTCFSFCLLLAGCGRYAQDGGAGASLVADAPQLPPRASPPPVQWDRDSQPAAPVAEVSASDPLKPRDSKPLDPKAELEANLDKQRAHIEKQLTVQIEIKGQRAKRDVDGWYEAIATNSSVAAQPGIQYRWHHARIDEMLARPAEIAPDLRLVLTSEKPLVAAAAGIGLARQERGEFDEWLAMTVRNQALPLPVRRAAAETLSYSPGKAAEPLLLELAEQYGDFSGQPGVAYVAALHAELLRGLAANQLHRPAESEKRPRQAEYARQRIAELNRSWKSPAAEARLAAAETWAALAIAGEHLPRSASELFTDSDPRVRIAALKMFASAKHPLALPQLLLSCDDPDLAVKLAAIEGLGLLGGGEASEKLKDIFHSRAERLRQAAVASLAKCGDLPAVIEAAGDTSWMVRCAVAESLPCWVTSRAAPLSPSVAQEAVPLARKLLTDSSGEVRWRAAQSLAQWPIVVAGPMLLDALESNDQRLRTSAAAALESAVPSVADFPTKAPLAQRREAMVKLRASWQKQFPPPDLPVDSHTDHQVRPATHLEPVAEIPAGVELRRMNALEVGQALRLVEQLASKAPSEQALAASGLATLGRKWQFSPEIVEGIAAQVSDEMGPLVWVSLLIAVENQTGPAVRRIVYLAASQSGSEVRRRACAWMAHNPAREHVEILAPLLSDSDPSVLHEAATAAGKQPGFDETALVRLLASHDRGLRVKVALSLCQLGSARGPAALERLSLDDDLNIRLAAASAMGETGDKQFVPPLVRLLDDSTAVQRAAMSSLATIAGKDIAEGAPSQVERIRAWRKWAGN